MLSDFTALENVTIPLVTNGYNWKDATKKASKILSLVNLSKRLNHFSTELSGGEQQRACLARALIKEPDIILADEPTGNLDPVTSFDLIKLLEDVNSEGTTIFMASHNYSLIKSRNHRIVEIHHGKLRGS